MDAICIRAEDVMRLNVGIGGDTEYPPQLGHRGIVTCDLGAKIIPPPLEVHFLPVRMVVTEVAGSTSF